MQKELLCFHASELPGAADPPEWIMYAPAGVQEIKARLSGRDAKVRVTIDEQTAQDLQRDLEARLASEETQPFFDFHHEAKEASGYPREFAWREGDKPGVYVRTAWSPKGREAVVCAKGEKPNIRYFSPRAAYDSDTQRITGLMDADTGNAAGGLVSDPAFTRISPLTAAKAPAQAGPDNNNNEPNKDMQNKLLAACIAAGLLSEADAKADNAHELLAAKAKELKDKTAPAPAAAPDKKVEELTASLGKVQTELLAMKGKLAEKFVSELQRDGKIPPRAELLAAKWKKDYMEDPDGTEKAAKELTAAKPSGDGAPVTDDQDGGAATPAAAGKGELIAAKARTLQTQSPGLDWTAAFDQARALVEAEGK